METKRKLFGTDGIRGLANAHPMTPEIAMQFGRGIVKVSGSGQGRSRVLIGNDSRLSKDMLQAALVAGVCSAGADALLVDTMPTPAVAFLTANTNADAGVMISASHNSFQDNGLKIFSGDGFKLSDVAEAELEGLLFSGELDQNLPTGNQVGRSIFMDDAISLYTGFLQNSIPVVLSFDGLRIVVDCANGAASDCGPLVFRNMGAEVIAINDSPDGQNINKDCGSTHPQALAETVIAEKADLGIGLDGDADRVVFVDHEGRLVDGDQVMAICARDMDSRDALSQKTVVATILSNLGLEKALESMGLNLIRTDVGDRYVLEKMREGGYNFGGEQSGHLIFSDCSTTGDGLLSAMQLLSIIVRSGKNLAELATVMERLPQVMVNVEVSTVRELDEVDEIKAQQKMVNEKLGESGRLLVRYSGTEPLVRVMIEGPDMDDITMLANETAAIIADKLG